MEDGNSVDRYVPTSKESMRGKNLIVSGGLGLGWIVQASFG